MTIDADAQRLGYRLAGTTDRGGTATVYRAVDPTGRPVALKVLAPGIDDARLDRELELLRSIDHPAVVRHLDDGRFADGTRYLVSQWIEGVTLHALLADEGPLAPARAVGLFEQLATVLDDLHRAGIVHRDLSPRNVMVSPGDRVTLIDFGLSRGEESTTITAASDLSGTPRYLAPEVIEGEPASPRSDQYSAALLLYEALAGTWPYPEGGSVATALHHQLNSEPIPLIETDPTTPASVDAAIGRALAKDPADRFPTVAAMVQAMADTDPGPSGRASDPARGSRRLVLGVAAAVAMVGLAGAATITVLANGDGDDTTNLSAALTDVDPTPTSEASPDPTGGVDTGEPLVVSTTAPPVEDAAPPADTYAPTAGTAAALACNLLATPDFDAGYFPTNYYLDEDNPARERVVSFGGVDNSPVLQVGEADGYGLYGEIVEILPGRTYVFGAWLGVTGPVVEASLDVIWLDGAYVPMAEVEDPLLLPEPGPLWLAYTTATAPPEARFAVPKLYKDSSPGVLLADELVFAPADSECASVIAPDR